MNSNVRRDFDWQRGLIPCIRQVLANYLITEAPFEDDTKRNTDLIVLKAEVTRVACRVRRDIYAATYGDEFTLRTSRPSGTETELAKVLSGWGDYIFYGFASEDGCELTAWTLGDLRVFRKWHSIKLFNCPQGQMPGIEKPNRDGSSNFRAYRINDLPPEFVMGRKPFQMKAA